MISRASLVFGSFALRCGALSMLLLVAPVSVDPADEHVVGLGYPAAHAKGPEDGNGGGNAGGGNGGGGNAGGGNGGGGNAGGNGKGKGKDDGSLAEDPPEVAPTTITRGMSTADDGSFTGSSQPAGPDLSPVEEEGLISRGWK